MLTWWYVSLILIMIIWRYVFLIQNSILLYLDHDSDSSHQVIIFFPLLFQSICMQERTLQVYISVGMTNLQSGDLILLIILPVILLVLSSVHDNRWKMWDRQWSSITESKICSQLLIKFYLNESILINCSQEIR